MQMSKRALAGSRALASSVWASCSRSQRFSPTVGAHNSSRTVFRRAHSGWPDITPVDLAYDVVQPPAASVSEQSLVICHGLL